MIAALVIILLTLSLSGMLIGDITKKTESFHDGSVVVTHISANNDGVNDEVVLEFSETGHYKIKMTSDDDVNGRPYSNEFIVLVNENKNTWKRVISKPSLPENLSITIEMYGISETHDL